MNNQPPVNEVVQHDRYADELWNRLEAAGVDIPDSPIWRDIYKAGLSRTISGLIVGYSLSLAISKHDFNGKDSLSDALEEPGCPVGKSQGYDDLNNYEFFCRRLGYTFDQLAKVSGRKLNASRDYLVRAELADKKTEVHEVIAMATEYPPSEFYAELGKRKRERGILARGHDSTVPQEILIRNQCRRWGMEADRKSAIWGELQRLQADAIIAYIPNPKSKTKHQNIRKQEETHGSRKRKRTRSK